MKKNKKPITKEEQLENAINLMKKDVDKYYRTIDQCMTEIKTTINEINLNIPIDNNFKAQMIHLSKTTINFCCDTLIKYFLDKENKKNGKNNKI